MLRSILFSTLLALLLCCSAVSAQTDARTNAAAEALFDEGLQLMRQERYAEACRRLEQSQNVDPAIGTLLYLADCYERLGRTASAWATFREASSQARAIGQYERAEAGSERAAKLEPALSRLTIELAAPLQALAGLTVKRDGVSIPRAVWNTAVPVDPGSYTVECNAPGYESFSGTVTVPAGGLSVSLPITELKAAPEPAPTIPAITAPTRDEAIVDEALPTESSGKTQRTWGIVVGAVGLGAIGLGAYGGLRAISKNNQAKEFCSGNVCSDPRGIALTDQALDAALLADISFGIGLAALAGGLILYFTAPAEHEIRVGGAVGAGQGSLQLTGTF